MAKIREREEGLLCEWPVLPDSIEGKDMSVFPMGFMGTKEVSWKTKQHRRKRLKMHYKMKIESMTPTSSQWRHLHP